MAICCFLFAAKPAHSQGPVTPPAAYTTASGNYIRTWTATAPEANPNTLMARQIRDVKLTTQYFDGLGRPLQTVMKEGSLETSTGVKRDMVVPVVYDAFGREQYQYLPFASTATDGTQNNGNFKLDPFQQQEAFYGTQLAGQDQTFYYSKTNYEASPLNRVMERYAPGNSWAGSEGNVDPNQRRGVQMKYWINTGTDVVRIWNVTDVANGFGTYTSTTAYPAGVLYKNVTIDEHKKQVIEFKDKEGKVVLKKVQLTANADDGTGSGHSGWLCTYYIYDDLGNLRCVTQPQAVKLMNDAGDWNLSSYLNEQCFRYEYDARNRMSRKKIPGAGEVYMVYDARDRLVLTQDANMRQQSKWMLTKYDELNRPIETALLVDGNTLTYHYQAAYNSSNYIPVYTQYELLTQTHYDDYTDIPAGMTYNTSFNGYFGLTNNRDWPYAQFPQQSNATKGMITWVKTKVLGTANTFVTTATYYDDKGRVIQVQSLNELTGASDIVTTQYTWAGQPLVNVQRQQITAGSTKNIVITKYTYDDLGRVLTVKKSNTNTTSGNTINVAEKTVLSNQYNKLGQLKTKTIATYYGTYGMESLNYDYNIRGWLLGMNRDYARDANNSNYFGFDLGYDKQANNLIGGKSYTKAQFNGNIAGMVWKSKGDGEKRKYDFDYDAVNRLLKADFTQFTGSDFNQNAGINYNVKMGDGINAASAYDANGNILSMTQFGWKVGGSASIAIDQLSYSYGSNTNKLQLVTDAQNDNNSKLGDFKYDPATKTGTDYSYDNNGNLVLDNNKKISSITYNHLNLPSIITVAGKGTITYTYDAAGNKLRKTTVENNVPVTYSGTTNNNTVTTTTNYVSGIVFESKTYSLATGLNYTFKLQFAGNEEGRIRGLYNNVSTPNTLTGFAYDYMLKDHLGNVRMVLTDEVNTNYYPAATLEGTYDGSSNSMVNEERKYYNIDQSKITNETSIPSWDSETTANTKLYYNHNDIPPASPNPNYPTGVSPTQSTGSARLYKTNASINKTGLEFVLKVMAGDKIDIFGKSYYLNTTTVSNSNSTTMNLLAMFTSLLLAPGNGIGAKGITATQLESWNSTLVPSSFFRGNNNETGTTVPKAYINYIFLDEQFKFVSGSASRVGASGAVKNHWNQDAALQNINVPKNGYLFVYVSNESNFDVFFDNLQVVHKPGPIVEETHYYPFGLTMAGISSKAMGKLENKKKFNGIEQTTELDLNQYDAFYRTMDPQIGRWWQTDPKPNYSHSLYSSMDNNPILRNDALGDTAVTRWRSGFLGLGKRHEARYVGGQWIDSKTRSSLNAKDVSRAGARRMMGDYSKLNTVSAYSAVTDKINSATNSVNLIAGGGSGGGSEVNTPKYFNDLNNGIANPDIDVYVSNMDKLDSRLFEGGKSGQALSYISMGHELGHAWDILSNTPSTSNFVQIPGLSPGISNSEVNAMYWENVLRANAGLPLRTMYNYNNASGPELPANVNIVRSMSVAVPGVSAQVVNLSSLNGGLNYSFLRLQ